MYFIYDTDIYQALSIEYATNLIQNESQFTTQKTQHKLKFNFLFLIDNLTTKYLIISPELQAVILHCCWLHLITVSLYSTYTLALCVPIVSMRWARGRYRTLFPMYEKHVQPFCLFIFSKSSNQPFIKTYTNIIYCLHEDSLEYLYMRLADTIRVSAKVLKYTYFHAYNKQEMTGMIRLFISITRDILSWA